MAQIAYVNWDGLVYYDGKVKQYIADKLIDTLKYGGVFETVDDLPSATFQTFNYVYKVKAAFTTDGIRFDEPLKYAPAGSLIQVISGADNLYKYTLFATAQAGGSGEDGGLTFDDIEDYLTAKNYVTSEVMEAYVAENAPTVDLSEIEAELAAKADNILFTESQLVGTAIGGFNEFDDVKGLTLTQLLTKILNLKQAPTSITLNITSHNFKVGEQVQLYATLSPADAVQVTIRWRSNSSNVTVSSTGLVKAVNVGSATVEAYTDAGLSETCIFDIAEAPTPESVHVDTPEFITEIVNNATPIYIPNGTGNFNESATDADTYLQIFYTPEDANEAPEDGNSFFYQIWDNTELIESGYQIQTVYDDEYTMSVALPEEIASFHVEQFNDKADPPQWQRANYNFSINTEADIPDGYVAYSEAVNDGGPILRFVIDERN